MLEIIDAKTEADFEAARTLCWAYRDVLLGLGGRDAEAVLFFYAEDVYRDLMADLPRLHAAPGGGLLLVRHDGQPLGCGMFYEFAPGVAEIKRVYLDPSLRGQGAGRRLMQALIDTVRGRGYGKIVMDTGRGLTPAVALYDRLGFRRTEPYYDAPAVFVDDLVYFEMEL